MQYTPINDSDEKPHTWRKVAVALALLGCLAGVGVVSQQKTSLKTASSKSPAALNSFPRSVSGFDTTSDEKVSVYIIAEAFCPNCKDHSYLFDSLIMNQGEDMRKIMDVSLDMLVLDGWFEAGDQGICEKGKFDCLTAQYHLAAEKVYKDTETHDWWDFSRCLFKFQPELIAYYAEEGHESTEKLETVVSTCASDSGLSYDLIKEEFESSGNHLLKMSYGRTIEYDMPVWVYVNGRYIEYEDDWINAVCAAYSGENTPEACTAEESLDGGHVAENSVDLFPDNDKVDIYIVAEAMCPNCKEHSYYFDRLVMSPEGSKSGLRSYVNVVLEQMVIDGWDSTTDTGMCEKGKWDCELSKYQLCVQKVDTSEDLKWWDYSRCLYKHQESLIEYYYDDGNNDPGLMESVHAECAETSGVDADSISSCVTTDGTELLKEGYERIGKMSEPVWIYVNNQRISYHEDWLPTICAAVYEAGYSVDECDFYADV